MENRNKGFTIVELLIVIVVIAILAAISIVAYNGIQQRGRDSQRMNDLNQLSKIIELYNVDNGNYPMPSGWCTQYSGAGYINSFKNELSKYVSEVPYDPLYKGTHKDYIYQNVGDTSYRLYAELESTDRSDDGLSFAGCVRTNNTDNEYDYRIPSF